MLAAAAKREACDRRRTLGLEAEQGLSLQGMKVTVVHLMPTLMERQLDEAAGWLLKSELERRGQTILTGADTQEIVEKDGHVAGVRLKDGREIPADIVVMAVGIRPSVMLAKTAGIDCERGILVDDHMVTSDPAVLAVGECVQHRGECYGLVAPLWEMCRALADHGDAPRATPARSLDPAQGLGDRGFGRHFAGADAPRTRHARARACSTTAGIREDRCRRGLYWGYRRGNWYFDLLQRIYVSEIRDGMIWPCLRLGGGVSRTLTPPLPPFRLRRNRVATAFQGQVGAPSSRGVQPRSDPLAVQGLGELRLVHRPRREPARADARRRGPSRRELDVQVHQLRPRRRPPPDPREGAARDPAGHAGTALDHARRLCLVPPGAQLLPMCAWPASTRRPEEPLRQRGSTPTPEDGTYRSSRGVRGPTNPSNAGDRRRGREVNAPMVKVTGRPADRICGSEEDLPAVWPTSCSRDGLGRLRQARHREDLRRRDVPLRSTDARLGVTLEQMTAAGCRTVKIAVSGCPRNAQRRRSRTSGGLRRIG